MVNKVILIGNLGADPEVRDIGNNTIVVTLNLATSYKTKNQTFTEWHRVDLWNNTALAAREYLKKGDMVYIEGSIRTDKWEDKDGNPRKTTKIIASQMKMLGSRANSSDYPNDRTDTHQLDRGSTNSDNDLTDESKSLNNSSTETQSSEDTSVKETYDKDDDPDDDLPF